MRRLKTTGQYLLGFSLLGLIVWTVYVVLKAILASFASLNPSVGAAIVAASATVLVSVFSVLISKSLEQRATIAKEIREKKVPVYEELIKFVFKVLKATKAGSQLPEQEIIEFMIDFTQQLIVWGSDEVIAAFHRFRNLSNTGDSKNVLFLVEDLLLAIRKDLGHKNQGLSQGKLLGLFVNDIENYLPKS